MTTAYYHVLSVEALRDASGWNWNSTHRRGLMTDEEIESFAPDGTLNTRKFIAAMRARGFNIPAGVAAAENDGCNYVVVQKNTREPWCAVNYSERVDETGEPDWTDATPAPAAEKIMPLDWPKRAPMSAEQLHTLLGDNRARIVGSQRARVLRKRGLDVRYAYDTTQGKRRYIWLMPIDTGAHA